MRTICPFTSSPLSDITFRAHVLETVQTHIYRCRYQTQPCTQSRAVTFYTAPCLRLLSVFTKIQSNLAVSEAILSLVDTLRVEVSRIIIHTHILDHTHRPFISITLSYVHHTILEHHLETSMTCFSYDRITHTYHK